MKKPRQDESLQVRITPEFKAHLMAYAKEEGLTLSSWVKLILKEASGYKRRGPKPKPKE